MADRIDIRQLIGLPPDDTARAFAARDDLRTTVRWSEMWADDHARAFTVAKVAKLDLLASIRDSLRRVLEEGGTFEDWQRQIVPELQRAGWWGMVRDRELTGTSRTVIVGPRRLRTIYDTNLRVSRAAGLWARIQQRKDVAPFLRYSAVMDGRTRPLHREWHGTILPVDHPWWEEHFPPNGWNCRCTVMQISQRQIDANGWKVNEKPPRSRPPRPFYRAGAERPEIVPAGIDPGFGYNPGRSSLRAIGEKAAATLEQTAAADLAAARSALLDLVDSDAFAAAMEESDTSFPVMVLDDEVRQAIGAQCRVAVLSSQTMAKQRRNHPELSLDDYRRLPRLLDEDAMVFAQDDQRIIIARNADGRWLKAVVKATADRDELFVVSFHHARAEEIDRLSRRYSTLLPSLLGNLLSLLAIDLAAEESAEEEGQEA
jgi:SPP1 gp7 family putative phage head morphogenesis protein